VQTNNASKNEVIQALHDLSKPCSDICILLDQLLLLQRLQSDDIGMIKTRVNPINLLKKSLFPMQRNAEFSSFTVSTIVAECPDCYADKIDNIVIDVDIELIGRKIYSMISRLLRSGQSKDHVVIEIDIVQKKPSRYVNRKAASIGPEEDSDNYKLVFKIPLLNNLTDSDLNLLTKDRPLFDRRADDDKKSIGVGIWIAKYLLSLHGGSLSEGYASDGFTPVCCFELAFAVDPTFINATVARGQIIDLVLAASKSLPLSEDQSASANIVGTYNSLSTLNIAAVWKVLLVDDSDVIRRVVLKMLANFNVVGHEADDGSSAVDMVRKALEDDDPYDVVLLDNEMPIMKGRDSVRIMREMGYKGRVFGVTGNVLKEDIDDFIVNGADLVILKPLTKEKFMKAMEDTEDR
jgi:CheY-like chemotaxis protein